MRFRIPVLLQTIRKASDQNTVSTYSRYLAPKGDYLLIVDIAKNGEIAKRKRSFKRVSAR